jgi:hypothetical protein
MRAVNEADWTASQSQDFAALRQDGCLERGAPDIETKIGQYQSSFFMRSRTSHFSA